MTKNPSAPGGRASRLFIVIRAALALSARVTASPQHLAVDDATDCQQDVCCLECFCCGPGTAWSADSSRCLPDPSSADGTCGRMDPSECYDLPSCTGGDCCGEGTVVDQDPDFPDYAERCLCYGEIPVRQGPTSPPVAAAPSSGPSFYGPRPSREPALSSSPLSEEPISSPAPYPIFPTDECVVIIWPSPLRNVNPHCILLDKRRRRFEAELGDGTPRGGLFEWTTAPSAEADRRVKMFGGAGSHVLVEGAKANAGPDDTVLTVTYTTPRGTKCSDSMKFTVVGYEASVRHGSKEGETELHEKNSVRDDCENAKGERKAWCDSHGLPTLGPIRYGDPAGSTRWAKNVEIMFELEPCLEGALEKCEFDIKRERQGRAGWIDDGGEFQADGLDCRSPRWCDDDPAGLRGDSDEDLEPDDPWRDDDAGPGDPPRCTIFVFDAPGFTVRAGNPCAPERAVGVSQLNLREWVAIGGELPRAAEARGDYVLWHASTRIRCEETADGLRWVEDQGGPGNTVDEGRHRGMEELGPGVN